AYAFYPTAPWCDLDGGPVSAPESQTILEGVACGHATSASVVLAHEVVTVRLPRAAQAMFARGGLPPPDAALALLTALDAQADGCLAWAPGQPGPEAISMPGANGARISGCFVLFVPQQEADGANMFEDGFACMLTDASWARVRHALTSGAPVTI